MWSLSGPPGVADAITDGAANTRYPMPPTSMTSESTAIAPTMPSTEAITGGRAPSRLARGLARAAPCDGPGSRRRAPRGRPARTGVSPRVIGAIGGAVQDRRPWHRLPAVDARPRPLGVGDADRDRERVGRVVGVRHLGELEDHGDHPPDLLLVRGAVARDADLDLVGRRLADGHARLGRREQHDAARLADRRTRSGRCARRTAARRRAGPGWWVSISSATQRVDARQAIGQRRVRGSWSGTP